MILIQGIRIKIGLSKRIRPHNITKRKELAKEMLQWIKTNGTTFLIIDGGKQHATKDILVPIDAKVKCNLKFNSKVPSKFIRKGLQISQNLLCRQHSNTNPQSKTKGRSNE